MDRVSIRAVSGLKPPKIQGNVIGIGILIVLGLAVLASSVFTIQPEEAGLVLRFGRFVRTVDPGLHFKFPRPIETVEKLAVRRQLKQEFGFRTDQPGVRTRYAAAAFAGEAQMLTGDLNVADVEWITQYRIGDPYKYQFRVRNVDETFRDMNEAVMREVIGDRSVTEVLTVGREEVESEVKQRLADLCVAYDIGITVEQVVMQDVNPPDEVKDAFNEVNQAQQERERMINEALSAFNRVIPKARGEALQTIQQAEGYATDRVNRGKGDAALFTQLLAAYRRAPDVTRRRIYLETMDEIFPKIERKIILDAKAKSVLPLLNLGEGK